VGEKGIKMNNLASNFDQIIEMAQKAQAPIDKKRGIIREFLQVRVIEILYGLSSSKHLSFVGGTSLRLLRGIDRFSEDLDFDNLGLTSEQIKELFDLVVDRLLRENIKVELKFKQKGKRVFADLKFPEVLYETKISSNLKEKLMVKLDSAEVWRGQKPEVVRLNQYGYMAKVLTNPIDQLLVQKLSAYLNRAQVQPRDMYDVVWLYAQGARVDQEFLAENKLGDLVSEARAKYRKVGVKVSMERKLQVFLFEEQSVNKLKMFGEILDELA
jgi:predicted nucleotidyltransferase component of viral defense system